jgi:hypothetical protein
MNRTRDLSTAFYMDRNHAQWNLAWVYLSAHHTNKGLQDPYSATCPETGEGWQYMGSYLAPSHTVHEFRHRRHPSTGDRVNVQVNVPR